MHSLGSQWKALTSAATQTAHTSIMDLSLCPRDGLLYHFIQSDKERVRPADIGRQGRTDFTPQTANETDAEQKVLVQKEEKDRKH